MNTRMQDSYDVKMDETICWFMNFLYLQKATVVRIRKACLEQNVEGK